MKALSEPKRIPEDQKSLLAGAGVLSQLRERGPLKGSRRVPGDGRTGERNHRDPLGPYQTGLGFLFPFSFTFLLPGFRQGSPNLGPKVPSTKKVLRFGPPIFFRGARNDLNF